MKKMYLTVWFVFCLLITSGWAGIKDDWNAAQAENTIEAYASFVANYPDKKKYVNMAQTKMAHIEEAIKKEKDDIEKTIAILQEISDHGYCAAYFFVADGQADVKYLNCADNDDFITKTTTMIEQSKINGRRFGFSAGDITKPEDMNLVLKLISIR